MEYTVEKCEEHKDVQRNPFNPSSRISWCLRNFSPSISNNQVDLWRWKIVFFHENADDGSPVLEDRSLCTNPEWWAGQCPTGECPQPGWGQVTRRTWVYFCSPSVICKCAPLMRFLLCYSHKEIASTGFDGCVCRQMMQNMIYLEHWTNSVL